MEFLIVIGLIIWAVASSAGKAQRTLEAQRRKEAQRRQVFDQAPPAAAAPARRVEPIRPRVQPTVQAAPVQPTASGRHVVRPSLDGGHAHSESSMTGFETCPPNAEKPLAERLADFKAAKRAVARTVQAPPASDAPTVQQFDEPAYPFSWDPAAVRNGLIYAEILGKPKALRR